MKTLTLITMAAILVGCGRKNEARIATNPLSEHELHELLTPGRTIAEVKKRLGAPSSVKEEDERIVMTFAASHDLLIMNVDQKQERYIVDVVFTNGVVESSKVRNVSIIWRTN